MFIECLRGVENVLLRMQTLHLQATLACKLLQLRILLTHLQAVLEDPLHCQLGGFSCSLVCFGRSCCFVYLGLLQRSQYHISYLQQHANAGFNRCCLFEVYHLCGSAHGCADLVTSTKTAAPTSALCHYERGTCGG